MDTPNPSTGAEHSIPTGPAPVRIEPGKPKEPPEAGKVSTTEQPVIVSSPPPRGIDEGEDQQS